MAITRLHMFDYDETLVATGTVAQESLVQAALSVIPEGWQGSSKELENVHLPRILQETTATTELNLAMSLADFFKINIEREKFAKRFYQARVAYLHEHSLLNGIPLGKAIVGRDIVYEDALILLEKLEHQNRTPEGSKKFHNIYWLVTGNPSQEGHSAMDVRLSPELRPFFTDREGKLRIVGGDEAQTRRELIGLAIQRSGVKGVYPHQHPEILRELCLKTQALREFRRSFPTNIFYYDDHLQGVEAGLQAKVRTIFCPEHTWPMAIGEERIWEITAKARNITVPLARPYLEGLGEKYFSEIINGYMHGHRPLLIATNSLNSPTDICVNLEIATQPYRLEDLEGQNIQVFLEQQRLAQERLYRGSPERR